MIPILGICKRVTKTKLYYGLKRIISLQKQKRYARIQTSRSSILEIIKDIGSSHKSKNIFVNCYFLIRTLLEYVPVVKWILQAPPKG